ncbi:hypothetical protein KSS87_022014, partial [Heliosperma pusillum]
FEFNIPINELKNFIVKLIIFNTKLKNFIVKLKNYIICGSRSYV